jgi:carboxyl-terminal processing protease
MVGALDPYASYIPPDDYTHFQESLDQEYGGIGIVVEINPETERLTVMTPLVGTPAHRAGVMAGDVILKIDDQDTLDMDMKAAVNLMRGKPGEPVKVTLARPTREEPLEMTLVREIIPVESVLGDSRRTDGSWNYMLPGKKRIAYVRLISFGEHTEEELTKALSELNGEIDGLIVDMRNNPGGLLTAAVATCDMFLDRGLIVSTRGRGNVELEEFRAKPGVLLDRNIPIAVLVNGYSASASEIVAACLQDNQRAVIVGQRTWGKGTVQNVIQMENGAAAFKLTTAGYWRPSGRNIHRRKGADETAEWGVSPNEGLEVKLTDEQLEKLMLARRARDVVGVASETPAAPQQPQETAPEVPEPPAPEVTEDETAEPQSIDPQLDKAIEYLEGAIDKAANKAEKA